MDRNEDGIVPGLLDAGKGVLHAGDIGEDLDALLGKVAQQEAADAEEVGVAGAENDDALVGVAEEIEHQGEIVEDLLLPLEIGEDIEMALMTDEHLGLADDFEGLFADPFPADDAGADQIDFLLGHVALLENCELSGRFILCRIR